MNPAQTISTGISPPPAAVCSSASPRPQAPWRFLLATGLILGLVSATRAQQFTDVSAAVGLVQEAKKSWGNPIWGDMNNDGFLDLIVPTHGLSSSGGPFVYLNSAGNTFTDIRATSGIQLGPELDSKDWHGISFGDYNGDGNVDVYVSEGAKGGVDTKRDLLFSGHGDGTFSYASDTAGIETSTDRGRAGFFVDYDNDGHLDLFVKNYESTNVLYHNNGSILLPVAGAGALADQTFGVDFGSIIAFNDYDLDGFMDLVIAGDGNTLQLYHNEGNGTFANVSPGSGLVPQFNSKGIAWGDYDNDGLPDLFVARAEQGTSGIEGASLYHNNGDGTFTDVTLEAGVTINASCWAAVWGDYDNDGYLDVFVTNSGDAGLGPGNANRLFHNNGDGTFTNVAASAGVALEDGVSLHKGAAWADYNNDGFLDLIVKDGVGGEEDNGTGATGLHRLFKNQGNANHFLKIKLKGTESNLHGIGARVIVTTSEGVSYRQNDGGGGGQYASQGSQPMHFGIGAVTSATVEVHWPSGIVNTVPLVTPNSTLTITEVANSSTVRAQNISTRLDVQTGAQVGIGGFIVSGMEPVKVLVRGIGPSLTPFEVEGALIDPVLELHGPNGTVVTNDNWRATQATEITATGLAPSADAEAALIATVEPGAYTAVISGKNDGIGIGLIEVYDLDSNAVTELANVSTRGFVGTDANVMIGGIIIGPSDGVAATLLVRAIGPTLASAGVAGSLADPILELHDVDGNLIAANDDWQDDPVQAESITAAGLAPGDPRESAIQATVPTGAYTAIVQGSGDTTGVALVEVYDLK